MAREKGTGCLQKEKSGRYTARVCINGQRFSRSTRTRDKDKATAFLNRFLAPLGLGETTLPLSEVWREYEKSPNRRDLSVSTMTSKRNVWMAFAAWIEANHVEITQLKQLSPDVVGEYLRAFRAWHTASTYNNHVCVLREICRVVSGKAGIVDNPWQGVRLLADDSHSRREFSVAELRRILDAAERAGKEWLTLFSIGTYTGLRLGDCCTLPWDCVDLARGVIQVIPQKTRKHSNGRPVTIPIHPTLHSLLSACRLPTPQGDSPQSRYVVPNLAKWYTSCSWKIRQGLSAVFKDAGIVTSIMIQGRRKSTPDATFHSLRHTFVSFSANAGVPLPVVSSIVGHTSTAMTRHYYHENEEALRRAVSSVPSLEEIRTGGTGIRSRCDIRPPKRTVAGIPVRLKRLDRCLVTGVISKDEYATQRARILAEL